MKYKNTIRWSDGSYDSNRICDNCGLGTCSNPVHLDRNKTVYLSKAARDWDLNNPVVGGK